MPEIEGELRSAYEEHHDVGRLTDDAQRLPGRLAVEGRFPDYAGTGSGNVFPNYDTLGREVFFGATLKF